MALGRQHIFNDILKGGSSIYHSAIVTCYSFDPFFYSSFFRPQLNARGIINQLVLIDAGCLDEAKEIEQQSSLPGSPFDGYTPLRIECPTGGVFHSKIGFYVGEKRITAVIGSGNLTYSGMSYNDEAWCAFSISSADSTDASVVAAMWSYLKSLISRQSISSAGLQVSWMLENSALLQSIDSLSEFGATEPDATGESFLFAANTGSGAIFDALVSSVGDSHVKSVKICAPFYDQNGTALKRLADTFTPSRIDCLVLPEEGTLPVKFDRIAYPSVRFFRFDMPEDSTKTPDEKKRKFVHAKMIQVETDSGTIFAIGSANASVQALGGDGRYSNDEADIIIKSSKGRNFLKDLGIKAKDEIADISEYHQSAKTDELKRPAPKVILSSCELFDDGYHISLSKGPVKDAYIHFVDDYGRSSVLHRDSIDNGMSVIPREASFVARTIFLEHDGVRISNKCVVIIRSEVEKKNPDKLMVPITRLLESARDSADFERLLQYVHIEEETQRKGGIKISSGASKLQKKDSNRELTDEDFEDKVFRNRVNTLEQINDRILERLAKLLITPSEDWAHMEIPQDEDASPENIDKGLPEDDEPSNSDTKEAVRKEYTMMDEGRGLFRRLLKYFGSLSWDLDDFKKDRSLFLIKRPFYLLEASDISLSRICIAVFEMCRIAKHGTQEDWEEMMDYFITLVGAHLLIFRQTAAGDCEAAALKKARKKRNFFVYSLLLISFWSDYGIRQDLLRLLTLNLMDSYKDNPEELKEAFREYTEALNNGLLPTEEDSVQMIYDCFSAYLSFITKPDRNKGMLSASLDSVIIYKKSFGFILLKDFRYGKAVRSDFPLVTCSAFAPGFPDLIPTSNYVASIRGMIANTSLNESALIFEKR